jgi:hypothetical protein
MLLALLLIFLNDRVHADITGDAVCAYARKRFLAS